MRSLDSVYTGRFSAVGRIRIYGKRPRLWNNEANGAQFELFKDGQTFISLFDRRAWTQRMLWLRHLPFIGTWLLWLWLSRSGLFCIDSNERYSIVTIYEKTTDTRFMNFKKRRYVLHLGLRDTSHPFVVRENWEVAIVRKTSRVRAFVLAHPA